MSLAKATLLSAGLMTGGTMLAGSMKAKAEQEAYDKSLAEAKDNAGLQLPIAQRLAGYQNKYNTGNTNPAPLGSEAYMNQPVG